MNNVIKQCDEKMKQAIEATRHELMTLRTGKATINFLDPVRVDYYGSKVPLLQVANLSVPDARMILISPWDPKLIPQIERAIREANLGFNPANDGRVVRVPVPPLTEERRKELCKKAREIGEKGKIAVRHIRHEFREELGKKEKNKEISEDDKNEGFEKIQKLHDKAIEEIQHSVSNKEKDIMEG